MAGRLRWTLPVAATLVLVEPARLAPFARFPQGLPPDIDRKATRGKYSEGNPRNWKYT